MSLREDLANALLRLALYIQRREQAVLLRRYLRLHDLPHTEIARLKRELREYSVRQRLWIAREPGYPTSTAVAGATLSAGAVAAAIEYEHRAADDFQRTAVGDRRDSWPPSVGVDPALPGAELTVTSVDGRAVLPHLPGEICKETGSACDNLDCSALGCVRVHERLKRAL